MVFKKGQASLFKGKTHSAEANRKNSEWHKGRVLSEEHRKKISEGCKGLPSKRKGRKFPQKPGSHHGNYKRGWKITRGYLCILKPEHPFSKGGYMYHHRIVMEEKLGRFLTPKEIVHHIDMDPSNNSAENLMIFNSNYEHLKFHKKLKKSSKV